MEDQRLVLLTKGKKRALLSLKEQLLGSWEEIIENVY